MTDRDVQQDLNASIYPNKLQSWSALDSNFLSFANYL